MKIHFITRLAIITSICSIIACRNEINLEQLQVLTQELMKKEKTIDSLENIIESFKIEADSTYSDLSAYYHKYKKSVYLIYAVKNDTMGSQGSAFQVGDDGIAISNFHVFKGAQNAVAMDSDGNNHEINIMEEHPEKDVIIFKIHNPISTAIPIANNIPAIGERCFAIGNPEGLTNTISDGIISSMRKSDSLIQITTPITHGSSGGPLFNDKGEVIGITTSGLDKANLNFAVNIMNVDLTPYLSAFTPHNQPALLASYYNSLFANDWQSLQNMYAPTLDKFQSRTNLSRFDVIRDHQKYYNHHFADNFKIRKIAPVQYNKMEYQYYAQIEYTLFNLNNNKNTKYVIDSYISTDNRNRITRVEEVLISKN